jgi:hypothetical protein
VACFWSGGDSESSTWSPALAIIPAGGGEPAKLFPVSQTVHHHAGTHWNPGGDSVLYVDNQGGTARIWKQPLAGGPPKPLNIIESAQIFHFQPGLDGQWIVSTGRKSSDVVILRRQAPDIH